MQMRCPTIGELPAPATGKIGWPWTEDCPQLPTCLPDGGDWPRISIVMVCLNRAQFIEETIRSVLLQGYPDLEFIIIDGASTDGTVEIIKQYEKWLGCFISEPDDNPVQAVNKGFDRMTGSLFGWLGSDDRMLENALAAVAACHLEKPEMMIAADVIMHDEKTGREKLVQQRNLNVRSFVEFWKPGVMAWHAIGIFTPVHLQRRAGRLDETLPYSADHNFFVRLLLLGSVHYLHQPVMWFRDHPESRTSGKTNIFNYLELARKNPEYWGLVGDVDVDGFRRFERHTLAPDLFYWGLRWLREGRSGGLKLMATGLRINPITAVTPTIKTLIRRLRNVLGGQRQ